MTTIICFKCRCLTTIALTKCFIDFECPICFEIQTSATFLMCGHGACDTCIKKLYNNISNQLTNNEQINLNIMNNINSTNTSIHQNSRKKKILDWLANTTMIKIINTVRLKNKCLTQAQTTSLYSEDFIVHEENDALISHNNINILVLSNRNNIVLN